MKQRIYYHGTNRSAVLEIQKVGFSPGTYFADGLQDALGYGGDWVFEVILPERPGAGWQIIEPHRVPPKQIVSLTQYTASVKLNNAEKRKELFQAALTERKALMAAHRATS